VDHTAFEILRDSLTPHVGEGAAHRQARELLPPLARALKGEPPVDRELSGFGNEALTEGVQRTFESVAVEIRYYYAAEHWGYDFWDRGVANPDVWAALPTYGSTLEILVPKLLEAIGRENSIGALKYAAGALVGRGATDEYPLCIQPASGEPATLYFPGVVSRITRAAPTLAPDFWSDKSVAEFEDPLDLVAEVLMEKARPSSDAEWFIWLYQAANNLVHIIGSLSAMQWILGELAAGYHGIDRHEMEAMKDSLTLDFTRSMRNDIEAAQGALRWKAEVAEKTEPGDEVDVATGIRIAGKAIRHAMLDEPFKVPVIATRTYEDPNGQQNRVTVTVNHPYVGVADAASALRQGLADLRELDIDFALLLSDEEMAFYEAVQSLRSDCSIGRDERVPHGFWTRFTERWNLEHPADRLTVNAARVRHHRLKHRKRTCRAI
jgi:hypothetical protein